jgi:flagellar biosynthesis/type III secretory pathway M-ring protein FliF/YscJ
MGALIVPIIIIVVVAVLAVIAVTRLGKRRTEVAERVDRPDVPTVRHQIQPGADPAAVVAELSKAGFSAVEDQAAHEIVVPVESADDRRRVEQIIEQSPGGFAGQ